MTPEISGDFARLEESRLTFITVSYGKKVYVNALGVEEDQADPRVGRVNRHNEQDADDPSLLLGVCVPSEVVIDLSAGVECEKESSHEKSCQSYLLTSDEEGNPHGNTGKNLGRL